MHKHTLIAVVCAIAAVAASAVLWTLLVWQHVHPGDALFWQGNVLSVERVDTVSMTERFDGEPEASQALQAAEQDTGQTTATAVEKQQTEGRSSSGHETVHEAAGSELSAWDIRQRWTISIPRIDVRAPVLLPSKEHWNRQEWDLLEEQMQVGLLHGSVAYPHSVQPGEAGATIVAGHSSPPDERAAKSPYGALFARLPELENGDVIRIGTGNGPVTYSVTKIRVVEANETELLRQNNSTSTLKLITCYPVGTTRDRLLVVARRREGR